MKRIVFLLFLLLVSTSLFAESALVTHYPIPPMDMLASHEYLLTLKHPLNGAAGLGVFKADSIEVANVGSIATPSIYFKGIQAGLLGAGTYELLFCTAGGERLRLSGGSGLYYSSLTEATSWASTPGLPRIYLGGPATNATPTYSFKLNNNTGLGRNAVGEPSMVASGVEAMRWTKDQTLIATGSAALPALAFKDDPDTGIYSSGANWMEIIGGGVLKMSFGTSYINLHQSFGRQLSGYFHLVFGAASRLNPTYTWWGFANTGMSLGAAGEPSMIASGVEIARFVATGTSGTGQLMLASGTTGNPSLSFIGDENTGIYSPTSEKMAFVAAGGTTYEVDGGGIKMGTGKHVYAGSTKQAIMFNRQPTNTTPVFTFIGTGYDTSGLGLNSIGEPSMVASGVEVMRWTKDQVLISSGSATLPALAFKDDQDTGIYSDVLGRIKIRTDGADMFGVSTNQLYFYASYAGSANPGRYQLRNMDSTGVNPAYTFNSDNGTGLGRYAVGQPSISASGTEAMRFTENQVLVATGSVTLPTYSFITDPDTGVYSPYANALAVAVAGTKMFDVGGGGMWFTTGVQAIAGPTNGYFNIKNSLASSTHATYGFGGDPISGLGRNAVGQPSMVASGVEAMRWTNTDVLVHGTPYVKPILAQLSNDDNATATVIAAQNTYYSLGDTVGIATNTPACQVSYGDIKVNTATCSFTIGATGSGTYRLSFSASFQGGNSDEYEFHPFVNDVKKPCIGFSRMMGSAGDVGSGGTSGFINLNPGDRVDMRVEQTTTTPTNITIRMFNFSLERVAITQ